MAGFSMDTLYFLFRNYMKIICAITQILCPMSASQIFSRIFVLKRNNLNYSNETNQFMHENINILAHILIHCWPARGALVNFTCGT